MQYKEKLGIESFISVEADRTWKDMNEQIFRIIGFYVHSPIRLHPAQVTTLSGVRTYVHDGLKIEHADFIYLDRPALLEAKLAGDILFIENININLVVVVDGRDYNANYLINELNKLGLSFRKFTMNYPSNDKILISRYNYKYASFLRDFSGLGFF